LVLLLPEQLLALEPMHLRLKEALFSVMRGGQRFRKGI